MRRSSRLTRATILSIAAAVLYVQAATGARAVEIVAPMQQSIAEQQPPPDQAARRSRYIAITLDELPRVMRLDETAPRGSVVQLDLFADVTVTALWERFDPNPDGTTWVGSVAGVPGSTVTLVYAQGFLTGSVVLADRQFSIRPAPASVRAANPIAAGALHVVTEVEQSQFGRELEPISVDIPASVREAADAEPQYDTAAFIDLLVVYTTAAKNAAGGQSQIVSLINLGVSETNTSDANSGVTQRIRLAGTSEVAYAEDAGGSLSTDLSNLRFGVGALSGVPALRNAVAADVVTMITQSTAGSCGVGYLMSTVSAGFESAAFNVVQRNCVSPNYSFAHELGHNMGLRHDWYMDGSVTPYAYAHGHVNTTAGNRFRTIMSYNDLCAAQAFNCTRVLYWSNPSVSFNGAPMGIPAGTNSSCTAGSLSANTCDADDQLALDNTALTVANFRQAIVNPNIITNGTFAGGESSWTRFSTPDSSYLVGGVSGGRFSFYRPAPPPGTPSQAVLFQNTGVAVATGTPLEATFDLGNTDVVDKRMSILLHDSDFSDLSVCTVWIPAGTNAPLTYRMRTHTTRAWTNASISFYAASANPAGNTSVFLLDNVTAQVAPSVSTVQTTCEDPFAPAPPSGGTVGDMLMNGNFVTGTTAGWALFGQIDSQVAGGVFEFRKLSGTPSGVVFQSTGQSGVDNQIYTSTFQLGNSSAERQRVTVIMHDSSFAELSACTFWIPPNTPLGNYAYRAYASKAWTNATLSIYPATVNGAQWLRLDNVTFGKTGSASLTGTHCIEPGGALPDMSELRTSTFELRTSK